MPSRQTPPARKGRGPRSRGSWLRGCLIVSFLALAFWSLLPDRPKEIRNLDTPGRSVVCFGDSLTAGVGAGPGEDIASRLASALGRPVVNAGVSGDTTASALARVPADVLVHHPGIVVVCLGGNDFLRGVPVETAGENLAAIVRAIQESGAMVVLGGFAFPSLSGDWPGMYARVAEREGCLLVPDLLAGITGKPGLTSDAVHPNAAGYSVMAGRLEAALRDLMRLAGWTVKPEPRSRQSVPAAQREARLLQAVVTDRPPEAQDARRGAPEQALLPAPGFTEAPSPQRFS